jgi:uncharacterized protein (DUF305 family)
MVTEEQPMEHSHYRRLWTMCNEAPVSAPDIKTLCETIIRSQWSEIEQMKAMLVK